MNFAFEYIKNFFSNVEATPNKPVEAHELVDGKAFTIKHYPLQRTMSVRPADRINATLREDHEVIAEVSEPINQTMTIDTISTFRFNDSLGFKHAVGVIFGQRNHHE